MSSLAAVAVYCANVPLMLFCTMSMLPWSALHTHSMSATIKLE